MTEERLFEVSFNRYREEYLLAVEAARTLHDPATAWGPFRDALWTHLARVFGVDVQEGCPRGFPDTSASPNGDARDVAAWLRQQGDEAQRSAATPRN